MFTELPDTRPDTPLLDSIDSPEQLRLIASHQLDDLARELRHYMLYSVNQSGGHFGAGLGVVELTIALHYVYNTPNDLLVWDVGHQAYPHKILTGRREQLPTIRQRHGLSAFPKREESPYDTFGVGHSSTSIGAALGMSVANKLLNNGKKTVAIIGDGAMTAGQAFEALTHAGHEHADMLVILNDNDMSISHSVGGLNTYFAKLLSSKAYTSMRENSKRLLSNLPPAWELARKTEEHVKGMVAPGTLFEELGFNYIGPIDGHDMDTLVSTLQNMSEMEGPQFLHVITKKGRGFLPAEENPIKYHALKPKAKPLSEADKKAPPKPKLPSYSNVFGQWLCDMAEQDQRLVGITPAMREGSDMIRFSELYPQRYHDVAIAEQHAVTFAAGLACEGAKPVVAIYSTFLQRAYDQLIHDVAIQNLDVLFAIDRAGLVGADGCTHDGSFDLSFLRCIPNMVIMAPSDENQCRQMLTTGYEYNGPAAVRYPRGTGTGAIIEEDMQALEIGKAKELIKATSESNNVALLSFGSMLTPAQKVAESLGATLVDMRFIKPLDNKMIEQLAESHDLLVTLEENVISGGAGSGVNEYIAQEGLACPVMNIGLPDYYVPHGNVEGLHKELGLDAQSIEEKILQRVSRLKNNLGNNHR